MSVEGASWESEATLYIARVAGSLLATTDYPPPSRSCPRQVGQSPDSHSDYDSMVMREQQRDSSMTGAGSTGEQVRPTTARAWVAGGVHGTRDLRRARRRAALEAHFLSFRKASPQRCWQRGSNSLEAAAVPRAGTGGASGCQCSATAGAARCSSSSSHCERDGGGAWRSNWNWISWNVLALLPKPWVMECPDPTTATTSASSSASL